MEVREFPELGGGVGWVFKGLWIVEGSGPYTGQSFQATHEYSYTGYFSVARWLLRRKTSIFQHAKH